MTVSDFSERDLIARIEQRLPAPPDWLVVGIGDDAAVVEPERNRVEVFTADASVDGVHFNRAFVPPDAIGHRALAVNLSDLAAMGAAPRLALMSLALPPDLPIQDFDAVIDGFASLAARHRTQLVGGNLTRTPGPLAIDITAVGTVKRRQALTRGGARAGDELYVTGTLGAARAGLEYLNSRRSALPNPPSGNADVLRLTSTDRGLPTVHAYLYPEPRIRAGALLGRNRVASACVDLSDGLADAAHQIAHASRVGIHIDSTLLPIVPEARDWFRSRGDDPALAAAIGGDDYELLVAVRPRLRRQLAATVRQAGVPLTKIGICTDSVAVMLDGRSMPAGYGHFRPAWTTPNTSSDVDQR